MIEKLRYLLLLIKKRIELIAIVMVIAIAVCLSTVAILLGNRNNNQIDNLNQIVETSPTIATSSAKIINSTSTPSPKPIPTQKSTPIASISPIQSSGKIIFGIGSQAGPAMDFRLVKEAPVTMLTSWYNGTKDLEWMQVQKNDLIPRLYKNKYVVHLITWTDLPENEIQTPYGPACGRPYPVSNQVVEDMKQLAQIYNGDGPLYLTLFTEFQTFTCTDNNWIGNENYFKTLKDNFRKIKDIFHQYAPQSKIALSWGGWQSRYDDPVNKGGRSLFPYFEDILRESDFTAFQTMESDTNIAEMLDMTRILGAYRKPVMLAHYKPSNGSHEVFDNDMRRLFTDEVINQLMQNGLFAFSFMDNELISNSETSYQLVKAGIERYGK